MTQITQLTSLLHAGHKNLNFHFHSNVIIVHLRLMLRLKRVIFT